MPEVTIEEAGPADVPTILAFIKGLAEYERLASAVVATETQLHATLFGHPRFAEVVIARMAGEPVGFALFFHNYSTFLAQPGIYLEDLFVLPDDRGAGVGRALLAHLAGLAIHRGCGRLSGAVLDWNEPAIAFYERLGARPLGDWTTYRLTGDALARLGAGRERGE